MRACVYCIICANYPILSTYQERSSEDKQHAISDGISQSIDLESVSLWCAGYGHVDCGPRLGNELV